MELVLIETSTMQILLLPSSRNYACCMSNTERSVTVVACCFFRFINRNVLEPLWNRDYIEQVDIVIKEKVTVSGTVIVVSSFD